MNVKSKRIFAGPANASNAFRPGRVFVSVFLVLFASAIAQGAPRGTPAPKPGDAPAKKAPPRIPLQEMIARADQVFQLPAGHLSGRLSVITKTGEAALWDVSLHRKVLKEKHLTHTAMLYQFSSKRRGLEAKVLIREDGESIWLWDALRRRLYRKRDREVFQGAMGTGFSFRELSGISLQSTYTGRRAISRPASGGSLVRLTLAPINPGRYRMLYLLADQDKSFRPLRIDFHGKNRILIKTMNLHYGSIRMSRRGVFRKARFPVRMEILDLNSGMISRLEYFTLDETAAPEDAFFDPDFLNR